MDAPVILVLATLDTKPDEARFVARAIAGRGCVAHLVDLSLRPGASLSAETSREAIAAAAGTDLRAIEALERAQAMTVVARGAGAIVAAMAASAEAHAALALGGGTGTWLANEILAALPHGFPKLIVSTLTGRDATRDIAVLPSVVDVAGLNGLLRPVLANAAAAICGMATPIELDEPPPRLRIALTMFGVTTEGGARLRGLLEDAGCEVITFHANGSGGQTMERLVREGAFHAVIDWTTSEITDELVGGICTAGPDRLEAAGECGVPQVVVPGAVDVINVLAPIPERFEGRTHHWHLPTVPLIRTSAAESAQIGAWMGEKLNAARGPVRVLVPTQGFSSLDRPGGPFEDQQADKAWEDALRASVTEEVRVDDVAANINDDAFALATARAALELVGPAAVSAP